MIADSVPKNPISAEPYFYMAKFVAPYSGITGQYDFTPLLPKLLFQPKKKGLYLFDQLRFWGSIKEESYVEGTDLVSELGGIRALVVLQGTQGSNTQLTGSPAAYFPVLALPTYCHEAPMREFLYNSYNLTNVYVTLNGSLNQVASMASAPSITLNIGFHIIEITDQEYLKGYQEAEQRNVSH